MKYSLIMGDKDNYQIISGYSKVNGYEHLNENDLRDIMKFTCSFVNKGDLKAFLQEEGLISSEISNKDFNIASIKENQDIKILKYGLAYYDDKKYFYEEYLTTYYASNIKNLKFLEKFINTYYPFLKNVKIFSYDMQSLSRALEDAKNTGIVPDNIESNIKRFIFNYIHKKNFLGKYTIDTLRMRDLAMHAINYEQTKDTLEEFIKENQDMRIRQQAINHYKSLLKDPYLTEEEKNSIIDNIHKIEYQIKNEYNLVRRLK